MAQWMVACKKADFKEIGKKFGIDQVTARILVNRGLTEEESIRRFLSGGLEELSDPHLLKDGTLLAEILVQKLREGKHIRIIGDYDIDGVMSSYILYRGLTRCGAQVSVAIPNRIEDGYGLNRHLITQAADAQVDTIITCDNGIAAIDEIAYAKELGMTVLVTDHHEIPFEEADGIKRYKASNADAIVNPHQEECGYPYKHLCGAAVAWLVIRLLYEQMGVPSEEAELFLENVAFATVGDVMPLTGENRILVKEGLKRLHHTTNVGMRALAAQCEVEPERVECYHIGFVLGPCINAAGRLDTAKRALELFLTEDENQATLLANELVVLNTERKEMTNRGVEEAKRLVESVALQRDAVLVLYLPEVHESIAGIIAGRIRECYHRPTFVLTDAEEGVKGSGRSIEEYSMYEELCRCEDLLLRFGGHPMAAGLTLPKENVDAFRKRLNDACTLSAEDMEEKIHIDVPMPVDYVGPELVRELSLLAPFGKDNPRPLFADRNLKVSRMWIVGKNQNVLRLSLLSEHHTPVSGIYFGNVTDFLTYMTEQFGAGAVEAAMHGRENEIRLSVVYVPKINEYHGQESVQIEIQAYR
ncbi:MAG: single-stranded-DNA-specific exonuclease RecJ [Agathobacter sp.]|nr:single-stranded-DNA-specific exonuclease RecJ [Agathobacter sp.]